MDELSGDYLRGFAEGLAQAALEAAKVAEERFWDGFAEGLVVREPYARGRGFSRARSARNLTRPSAGRAVAR